MAKYQVQHYYEISFADGTAIKDWASSKVEMKNEWGFYSKYHGKVVRITRVR